MHDHNHDHAHHDHGDCCGPDHAHEHHDHAHAHDHSQEHLEQLLTVGICGAFGIIATALGYQAISEESGMLRLILAKPFWPWVLGGGIVLTVFSVVRGIVLVRNGAESCCSHADGDDHSHGNVYWRVIILLFPLLLFGMGLPNQGFSPERIAKILGPDVALNVADLKEVKEVETAIPVSFDDVANALRAPELLETLTGKRTSLRGQLKTINDREFTLFTLKQTCCQADAVPLKARIVIDPDVFGSSLNSRGYKDNEWLKVEGVLQFVPQPGKKEPLPVVRVKLKGIDRTTPDL